MPQDRDIDAARKLAEVHVEHLHPRWSELSGRDRWYRREMLQEALGITETNGVYDLPFIAGHALRDYARTNKAAHSLASRIINSNTEQGARVPPPLQDIASGAIPAPKRRGKTGAENGVRDLIFKTMAVWLQDEFDLPLGRNDAATKDRDAVSACEIIHDAFRENGHPVPDDRSIEKAIRNCN